MIETLRLVLRLAERPGTPTFDADDTRPWAPGARDALLKLGVIREIAPTDVVYCDGCIEGHTLHVDIRKYPSETVGVARCPDCGRVHVPPDRLRRWQLDFAGLARAVADALGTKGRVTQSTTSRMCSLGHMVHGGMRTQVLLARGLALPDAQAVVDETNELAAAEPPVLLTTAHPPREINWPGRRPRLHALTDLLDIDDGKLCVDRDLLAAMPVSEAGSTAWLTVAEAGVLLCEVVSGLEPGNARARVSKAASAGKFKTNGQVRAHRRIDRDSFNTWRFEQREKDLARSDW